MEMARRAVGPQLVSSVSGLEMKAFHQLKVKLGVGNGSWDLVSPRSWNATKEERGGFFLA